MGKKTAAEKITAGAKAVKKTDEQIEKILTIEEILAAEDITEKTIPVKEWGGSVVIRTITKTEFDEISESSQVDGEVDQEELQRLLILVAVRQPHISSENFEAMKGKSAGAFLKVVSGVMEHSGLKGISGQTAREKRFRS